MAKKKRLVIGDFGIVGNSGLTGASSGILHISANYDSNGMVFIEWRDGWKRVKKETAKKHGYRPIQCAMCTKPAVSLDHHYPYMSDMNRCKKHYGKGM